MYLMKIIIILFVVLGLFSCSSKTENVKVDFLNKDTTFVYGTCESDSIGCVVIELSYIKLSGQSKSKFADSLNKAINQFLFASPFTEDTNYSFETLKNSMINDFENIKSEFQMTGVRYSYERNISVALDTNDIFTLAFGGSDYFGGAHPNSFFGYTNFNKKTGSEIQLSELLIPNFDEELDKIGEKIFRNEKDLRSEEDLTEAGYWFEDGKFALNRNYLITPKSLIFIYNPYEIASYAEGFTEIEIGYDQIKSLIKKDGMLPDFIH